ncbi:MAG: response regulator [Phycisphaerae bacterium]
MTTGPEYKILIVDDSPPNRMILSRGLRKAGYETIEAADGFIAEEIATREHPDLILLDVMMPGRDGFQVCDHLKENLQTAEIPIIFLTAKSESEDIEKAFSVGGCDYVTKPFRIREVKARMEVHLHLRKAQQELERRNRQLEDMSRIIAETNCELARQARTDALCGVLNRGAWEEAITAEHRRYARSGRKYCVIMIDVDHFKLFNDTLGHQAGDDCLRKVALLMQQSCRATDVVGRYGGEEFTILAPETDLNTAAMLAERIRADLCQLGIRHPASPVATYVSASFGAAEVGTGSWENALTRADEALYGAKTEGRNRVCLATGVGDSNFQKDATTTSPREPRPSRRLDAHPFHTLVVTERNTERDACRAILERKGYRVTLASDGASALAHTAESAPDLIVVDATLPDMQTMECVRKLKQKPGLRDARIMVLGCDVDDERIAAFAQAGADEFIAKPVQPTELALRVDGFANLLRERSDLLESYELRGEQTRILALLLDFCGTLGMAMDLDEVLEESVAAAAALTSCRQVSIMLPVEESKTLAVVKSIGMDAPAVGDSRIHVEASVASKVFATSETVVFNSSGDLKTALGTDYGEFGAQCASVPLVCSAIESARKTVGVLNVSGRLGHRPFVPHELESIELLSKIAGTSIYAFQTRKARDKARDSILVAIARLIEHHERDCGNHIDRVTHYALKLATQMRTDGEFAKTIDDGFLHNLERAVPIHDVGQIAIPDRILDKPGAFTPDERELMRTHVEVGAQTIQSVRQHDPGHGVLAMAEEIALAHHEWFDGTGYPKGLTGKEIPLAARIVALADAYDAITTKRAYKDPVAHDEAITIILKQSGTQFDPAVVEAFLKCEPDFRRFLNEIPAESYAEPTEARPAMAEPAT